MLGEEPMEREHRMRYPIGEAAKAAGLPVKTIRYYEEIGLVPKAARTNGGIHAAGRRLYSDADIGRLSFIRHARLFGLSLADIRKLLALAESKGCPSKQPEYRETLRSHLRAIDERINHLLGLRTAIQALMAPARQAGGDKCSWEKCACMQHAPGVKGGHHV